MKVPYSYLLEQFAEPQAILRDIEELVKTGQYTLGPAVAEFESSFAKLCGVKYAVGVGSGTDALLLALKAIHIGPGGEVITAANTFIATVSAIATAGARPVFVDVTNRYNIDPNRIEDAVTGKTKALMPVHLNGDPADMPAIMEIAKRHNLYVIEDACQAISASINGQICGSFGIAAGFSLHPLKNLNVWGDGGVVVTNSKELHDKLLLLRNYGLKNRDEAEIFGYNSRLDTLQAIVGNHLIKDAESITNKRIENARRLDEAFSELADYITIPPRPANIRHVYHIYMVQVKDRDELYKYLLDRGIEVKIHYPVPVYLQKPSRELGYKPGDFPVCDVLAKSIISFPVHQHLTDDQTDYMIDNVRRFYKR